MLTPSFDIEQNDQFVVLTIRVPYIKISEAEFYINGTEFKFYCKPYFLRLHLPGELADDDRQKASYDVDKGTIVAHLPKLHPGRHFENLGMITSLLSKKPTKDLRKVGASPRIEEVTTGNRASGDDGEGSAGGGGCDTGDGGESGEESDDFDWEMEQQIPTDETTALSSSRNSYGFANQHSGVFAKLQEEIPSIVDCPDPDHMTSRERRVGRVAHEEASFDPEHYLADLMDSDTVEDLLNYEPPWREELVKWRERRKDLLSSVASVAVPLSAMEPGQDIVSFAAEERDQLKELPNRDFLLDKAMRRSLYLGLVDIIFAFAYDNRTTLGENNVESAWNVCKLSSTLSWLEVFQGSVHEVIYCCLRRALTYPLFRHWQLALTVLQDTRDIFRLGRRKVLQCLLAVRQLLNSSEPYYILNNLYITEYCVWIQRASAKKIQSLADELDEVKVDKSTVGWDLLELEEAARLVIEEECQRDKGEEVEKERAAMTGPQSDDTRLEQLTCNFEKIQLSGQGSAGEGIEMRADKSTETHQRTSDPTLSSGTDNPTLSSRTNDPTIVSRTNDPMLASRMNEPTLLSGTDNPTIVSRKDDPTIVSRTNDPALTSSHETHAEENSELTTTIRLSSTVASDWRGKPLIEELDQHQLSDSETGSTMGSSSSTCSSSGGSESESVTEEEEDSDSCRQTSETAKT